MKWQKRDCPINLELVAYGSGWEDITLYICGDHHWWSVSGCLGDGFGALVESLYALYPDQPRDEYEARRLAECDEYVGEYKDGQFVNLRPREKGDSSCFHFPKRAEFYWDLEGAGGVAWKITRESGPAKEFNITIELRCGDEDDATQYKYEVRYSDLCYAVGKAMTEVVKKNGFAGFYVSVWESDINVRHLCFLKACGMGKPDAMQPFEAAETCEAVSSFEDEIELLMFDM